MIKQGVSQPNKSIVVKYQTQKNYCSCCYQKLPKVETSKTREFEFSKENALSYANWSEIAEYPEDIQIMVPDFVYETISFYATNSNEKIIIEESEVERVKNFILSLVVSEVSHDPS